jgi:hypothetical protein
VVETQALAPVERVKQNELAVRAVTKLVQDNYIVRVQGRAYLMVAGAQAVATSMGYTTAIEQLRYVPATDALPGYWEATATVMADGRTVGRGIASVFDNESPWNKRPQFARQAMAQTRATGRALKGVMGWACALLGAETSLAEEMPQEEPTMPAQASEAPRRLPAPSTDRTPQKAAKGLRQVSGVCAGVESKVSKAGKSYWRIGLEAGDGVEWFTTFKEQREDALKGKRIDLTIEDREKGPVVVDVWESEEVPF